VLIIETGTIGTVERKDQVKTLEAEQAALFAPKSKDNDNKPVSILSRQYLEFMMRIIVNGLYHNTGEEP
jgi:hypothetical protein